MKRKIAAEIAKYFGPRRDDKFLLALIDRLAALFVEEMRKIKLREMLEKDPVFYCMSADAIAFLSNAIAEGIGMTGDCPLCGGERAKRRREEAARILLKEGGRVTEEVRG